MLKKELSANIEYSAPEKNIIRFKGSSGIEGKVVVSRSMFSRRKIRLNAKMKFPNYAEKQAGDILSYLAAYVPSSES